MLPISVQAFYATSADLQKVRSLVERQAEQFPVTQLVVKADKDILINVVGALHAELVKLDCRAAIASARRLAEWMDNNTLTYGGLIALVDEMDGRIRDELATSYVFTLTAQEAGLYDPAEPLISLDFQTRFEGAAYDVEECAKCHALGRSTASVFHAMRVLEKGIAAISACLSIPDPVKPVDRNWGRMLEKIDGAIKAKWPSAADRETGDGHLFESLLAILATIRNPWRNKSMHPAQKYTEQEAARIINAVGNFMQQLSERCDEKGEPKA